MAIEWQIATVKAIKPETAKTKSFTLGLPNFSPHRAGQHYDLRLTAADGYQAQRSYSIASPPEQAESRLVPTFNPAAVWLVGAALSLLPLLAGLVRSAVLRAKARNILDASWISLRDQLCVRLGLKRAAALLEVDAPIIPLSCGVMRPAVVLPHSANEWNERLRRFVLLHAAHVDQQSRCLACGESTVLLLIV